MRLNDAEARGPLRQWIRANRKPDLLVDELPVREGRARVDLASITDDLHSYEIKGQTDRLERLKTQTIAFGKVSHYCSIVTTANYVEKIHGHVPDWWEIILVEPAPGGTDLQFHVTRPGQRNIDLDYRWMAFMLWKAEMLDLFEHYGHVKHPKTPKSILVMELTKLIPDVNELWGEVRESIKARVEDPIWKESHIKD